jgi:hypothetical protein
MGLDYVATFTAIAGMYYLCNRKRIGFVMYFLSSLSMIGFAASQKVRQS